MLDFLLRFDFLYERVLWTCTVSMDNCFKKEYKRSISTISFFHPEANLYGIRYSVLVSDALFSAVENKIGVSFADFGIKNSAIFLYSHEKLRLLYIFTAHFIKLYLVNLLLCARKPSMYHVYFCFLMIHIYFFNSFSAIVWTYQL